MSIIFGLIILAALIALGWNLASRLPCPAWLGWLVEQDNPFTKTNRASVIIEHLDLEPGMAVLDAGCGPGRLTIPLAKAIGVNGKVTALDLQQRMLQRVEEKAREAGLHNIQYVHAGIGEGKLNHSQYDRALLVTVLGEIPDRQRALKELFEALKPGGILSITEVIFDPHFLRQNTVLQLMQQAGFQKKMTIGNRFAYTMLFEKP